MYAEDLCLGEVFRESLCLGKLIDSRELCFDKVFQEDSCLGKLFQEDLGHHPVVHNTNGNYCLVPNP